MPFLIPTCGARDKPIRSIAAQMIRPTASRGPLRDDKRLAAAAADPSQPTGGLLGLGVAVIDGIHTIGATVLSGTTEAFGGMGGALDGALTAMQVPVDVTPAPAHASVVRSGHGLSVLWFLTPAAIASCRCP